MDIYLADFKYASDAVSKAYSHASDYPSVAENALREMCRQQPQCVYNGELLQRGVIVRHLLLPGQTADSKDVVEKIADICGNRVWLSLMRQYTPPAACAFPELMRPIADAEYNEVVNYALLCGLKNIFLQEKESVSESFIPAFDYEGVLKNGTDE